MTLPQPGEPLEGAPPAPMAAERQPPTASGELAPQPPASAAGSAPTTPWWPGAVVSAVLPVLGLLTVRDGRDRRQLAWGLFAAVVLVHLALRLLHAVAGVSSASGENWFGTLVRAVELFWTLSSGIAGAVFTHDETVRAFPHLGRALLFREQGERAGPAA